MSYWGGIEAGGTKFVCAVADDRGRIINEAMFATTTYRQTTTTIIDFLTQQHKKTPLSGIGISSFGPLDLSTTSPTYGHITSTPKKGWEYVDLVGPIKEAIPVPIGLDTDVNGAALAEHSWGAAQGLETFVYMTIGTGIGGGGIVNGKPLHGLLHPEMGHMAVPRDHEEDPFSGVCSFHGDCLEGLASGPAIKARWGMPGESLPPDHAAWELQAKYLGLGLANIIYILSPQRIVLGGGVMEQTHLYPMIRERVQGLLNNYVKAVELLTNIDQYIVPPELGHRTGVMGGIAMAQQMVKENAPKKK
jgi:fructokinase